MPEIGEVARTVHYIRKLLVGKTLAKVTAAEDANVYGKVGCSHTDMMKHLTGKKVVDAGQQGKYFWMIMSSPPHPVMHFGMAGWLKFKDEHTYYYKPKKGEDKEEWPPKYWKFILETGGKDKVEAAFVDMRRFARIRLVDCPAKDIRKVSPLKENGPDPVQDKDVVSVEWLIEKCRAKKVPIKAMLLDQANISGIGNWVGDEIMYNAKMHPEQYANTLSDEQIKQLHKSIHYICGTAVDLLADSDAFPEEWLFKHRWGKGKKDAPTTLPTGEKIAFLTVGGRTSAIIPSVQKKTGPVAKELSDSEGGEDEKPKKAKGRKRKAEEEVEEKVEEKPKKASSRKGKAQAGAATDAEAAVEDETLKSKGVKRAKAPAKGKKQSKVKDESEDDEVDDLAEEEEVPKPAKRGRKTQAKQEEEQEEEPVASTPAKAKGRKAASTKKEPETDNGTSRRRSGRLGRT